MSSRAGAEEIRGPGWNQECDAGNRILRYFITVPIATHYLDYQVEEDKMGGAYKVSVGKLEVKKQVA